MIRSIAIVGLVLVAAAAAVAQGGRPFAGYVVSPHTDGDFDIVRTGASVSGRYYIELYVGDVIRVKRAGVSVRLNFVDHTAAKVTQANSPYTVGSHQRRSAYSIEDAFRQLGGYLSRAKEEEVSAIGRGDNPNNGGALALSIPELATGAARIGEGVRIFGVAWQGGTAPFVVTLSPSGKRPIIAEDRIEDFELIVASRPTVFEPGRYVVTVRDAKDREVTGQFTVVSRGQMPAPPPGVLPDFLDPAAKAVASGAWLLSNQPKTYWYEAYLQTLPFTFGADPAPDAQLVNWTIRSSK